MSAATPDVSGDLIAKISALLPADFPAGTVFADGEDPVGGLVGEVATWVKFSDEVRDDYDLDGAIRHHTFQVKRRADRAPTQDPKAALAKAAMVRLYDAANKVGAWTGTSGARYIDLVARTFPRVLEEQYVVMDLTVDFDTLSS